MKKLAFLLFFISFSLISQVEKKHFNVIHNDGVLGTLDATKTINGKKISYTSYTDIEYHLLTTIKIEYNYEVIFINQILEEAKVHIMVRGHDKTNVKTLKSGDNYQFYSDDKIEKTLNNSITHSIEQLLFEEPMNISQIYAEEHGEYHTIKKIGEHKYLKTSPNGNKNTYYYKNGELQKSDVDAGIIKFSIIKKN